MRFQANTPEYNNVVVETDYASNLPMIEVSQTEVQQVMLNLINNSLDAMEKTGGKINIKTRVDNEPYFGKGFADNGPGIPEIHLARDFSIHFTPRSP